MSSIFSIFQMDLSALGTLPINIVIGLLGGAVGYGMSKAL